MITKPTKYTSDVVLQELELMLADLRENKEIVYIGELFENKRYDKSFFIDLVTQKYQNNTAIKQNYNAIKSILESRAITGSIKGKYNPASVIFHLKNNYGWTDKQDIAVTATTQNLLSDEQVRKIASRTLTARVVKTPSSVKALTEPQEAEPTQ